MDPPGSTIISLSPLRAICGHRPRGLWAVQRCDAESGSRRDLAVKNRQGLRKWRNHGGFTPEIRCYMDSLTFGHEKPWWKNMVESHRHRPHIDDRFPKKNRLSLNHPLTMGFSLN